MLAQAAEEEEPKSSLSESEQFSAEKLFQKTKPATETSVKGASIEIKEGSINYKGRTVKEGKKINFYDAIRALTTILKYRYFYKFKI